MIRKNRVLFRTGVRLASPPAVTAGLIIASVLFLIIGNPYTILISAAGFSLLVFILVYFTAHRLLKPRLDAVRSTIHQTPARQTGSPIATDCCRDELEELLRYAEWSKQNIRDEFQRMDENENYRKEFIGDISHELKTPIFSVQGYLETLLDGAMDDPEVNKVFLSKAMKNVARLMYLTNDLMEISRLETGELKPELSVIPINNIIHDVIDTLQYKADQRGVRLIFEEKESNAFVLADRNQIRQVLMNLIENAIKYNKPDGHVSAGTRFPVDDRSKILVSVRDTGIGIEPEDIKRVTERFFRVDKSRSREQGGTGLGLSIVKHILESHQEQLIIESKPGSGSLFCFTLKSADYHSHLISA